MLKHMQKPSSPSLKTNQYAPYIEHTARLAIYAPGEFGKGKSKTGEGVMRYAQNPIAAVIDSSAVGKTIKELTNIDCHAPIVGSISEALKHKPDALLLGTAWTGGQMPKEWRKDILQAIDSGLDIVNGLHDFLTDDIEMVELAKKRGCRLYDVRRPPDQLPVAAGLAIDIKATTVLTVGSDCSVGKMTTSLELQKVALAQGFKAEFVATGQTGIMIAGSGITIDRVIGDFMAGATEQMVLQHADDTDYIFVEGQGSLVHPGFSGVTLALLHGAAPKSMILCHKAVKTKVSELQKFDIPPLKDLVALYESMSNWVRPSKVVGIAINTVGLSDQEAKDVIAKAEKETGLPATDPVRYDATKLFEAIKNAR